MNSPAPSSSTTTNLFEFDGRRLKEPERFRMETSTSAVRRIAELRSALEAGRISGPEVYRDMTDALRGLAAELTNERNFVDLERFSLFERSLSRIGRGECVVFMGVDPGVHGQDLHPIVEMFRKEKLILGREYVVVEKPDIANGGRSFAISAPDGIRHLCCTYFGVRRPKEEAFVTDWAMG